MATRRTRKSKSLTVKSMELALSAAQVFAHPPAREFRACGSPGVQLVVLRSASVFAPPIMLDERDDFYEGTDTQLNGRTRDRVVGGRCSAERQRRGQWP